MMKSWRSNVRSMCSTIMKTKIAIFQKPLSSSQTKPMDSDSGSLRRTQGTLRAQALRRWVKHAYTLTCTYTPPQTAKAATISPACMYLISRNLKKNPDSDTRLRGGKLLQIKTPNVIIPTLLFWSYIGFLTPETAFGINPLTALNS